MAQKKVLVIDANPAVQAISTLALGPAGLLVETAASAEAGLALFHQTRTDVVICAHELPGANALELCAKIRSAVPETKILLLVERASMEKVRHTKQEGLIDEFLVKPFKSQAMRAAVEEQLAAPAEQGERPDDFLIALSDPLLANTLKLTIEAEGFGAEIAEDVERAASLLKTQRFRGIFYETDNGRKLAPLLDEAVLGAFAVAVPGKDTPLLPQNTPSFVLLRPLSAALIAQGMEALFPGELAEGLRADVELGRDEQSALAANISARIFEKLLVGEALKKGNWRLASTIASEEVIRTCREFRTKA